MSRQFTLEETARVDATPEQVWAAIATGPGIDSWYMGRSEVEPGAVVRTAFGDFTPEQTVTAWRPGERLAYETGAAPDGRFVAYEFLIEGRDRGSAVVRMATSGFLPGDDWADEFEAMSRGTALFFHTLVTYLTHFPGRTATPVTAFGPMITDWDRTRGKLHAAIGLRGDRVSFTPAGLPPVDGQVFFRNEDTIGIHTPDAIYRFLRGFRGPVMACHHIFTDISPAAAEQAWRDWLNTEDLT